MTKCRIYKFDNFSGAPKNCFFDFKIFVQYFTVASVVKMLYFLAWYFFIML